MTSHLSRKHSSPPCNICLPYSLPSSHLPHYCRSTETRCRDHRLSGIHGIVRFGHFNVHPVPQVRRIGYGAAMHPRNQFFLYRTHYCCRNDGRASAYLRFLHRSIYRGNVHQPNLEIYQENHYALISGIVVTLIGMSLIKVGITACGGGAAAQADGSFGSLRHVGLAALVLLLIIAFNRSSNRYMRMSSIVIGLVIGYIVAWFMGIVDFTSIQSYGGFNLPMPFRYGLTSASQPSLP